MTFEVLTSEQDASVNHILPTPDGGALEARFVRRGDAYFIVYLSSHTGCDKACRMCHLTQTGQTMMTPVTMGEYYQQAYQVLKHWFLHGDWRNVPEFINFNFMARGEPFANENLFAPAPYGGGRGIDWLEKRLTHEVFRMGVKREQFNYSTIMPASMPDKPLHDLIGRPHWRRNIYYSLYSMSPRFRKRWLPKAMDPDRALDLLADYQTRGITGHDPGEIVLHWSFIAGQNDDEDTIGEIIDAVKARGLKTRFNCVRYNPYSPAQGQEPSEDILARNTALLSTAFGSSRTRIVPRVGFDVKASCGMFLAPDAVHDIAERQKETT